MNQLPKQITITDVIKTLEHANYTYHGTNETLGLTAELFSKGNETITVFTDESSSQLMFARSYTEDPQPIALLMWGKETPA